MNKKPITLGLTLIILFQITVLASEYLGAVYPLWTGEQIKLKIRPVDPRSLFRGNYARLNYDISTIRDKTLPEKDPRNGEVVYVKLKPEANGLWTLDSISLKRPEKGSFIRGRINRRSRSDSLTYTVRYGIEAYFAPKEKALTLEKGLRDGGVAIVMIARNGRAALKEIIKQ